MVLSKTFACLCFLATRFADSSETPSTADDVVSVAGSPSLAQFEVVKRPRRLRAWAESPAANKGSARSADRPKSVLLIIVDDLRPSLGAYNDTFAHTPNIDALAAGGVIFKKAYTQFAWCSPSRNSFLSGRVPDTTRTWNFLNHFRETGIGKDWRSLPQYFKEHGYTTASAGKVYHPKMPPNNDYPKSWSFKPYSPECLAPDCPDNLATMRGSDAKLECLRGENLELAFGISPHKAHRTHQWCATDVRLDETNESNMMIDQLTQEGCRMQLRSASSGGAPFFVACGFHRPHVPWRFPAEVLKFFPKNIKEVPLPKYSTVPEKVPLVAWHEPGDLKGLEFGFNASQSWKLAREYRLAYAASVAYVDAMIGKVLTELRTLGREDDTLVVLTSDHGYSLGEQGIWDKMSNFETALRVPLIMRAPWLPQAAGVTSSSLVELLDLYPTIAEVAGLPDPRSEGEGIDGASLASILGAGTAPVHSKRFAFSQFAKPEFNRSWKVNTQTPREELQLMGYSIRNDKWRYTVWFRFTGSTLTPDLSDIVARELYDHRSDSDVGGFDEPAEQYNVASSHEHSRLVEFLHKELIHHIVHGGSDKAWHRTNSVEVTETDSDVSEATDSASSVLAGALKKVIADLDVAV